MIKQECNGLHYVQHACQYSWYQNLFLQAMAIGQISCNDADMLSGNMILRYDYLKLVSKQKIMLIHALKTYIVLLSNTRRNASEKFI